MPSSSLRFSSFNQTRCCQGLNLLLGLGLVVLLSLSAWANKPAATHKWHPASVHHTSLKSPIPTASPAKPTGPVLTTPMELVKNPGAFLNKTVRFEGHFSSYTNLGLDFPEALRESKTHVGLLVFRGDVYPQYHISLSELKLFVPRKGNEKLEELNPNDAVSIEGKVFTTVLGDPWVDVIKLTKTSSAPVKEATAAGK